MSVKVNKVVTTTTTYTLTPDEVAEIIRQHLGVSSAANVEFDVSGYQEWLEGVTVTETEEVKE